MQFNDLRILGQRLVEIAFEATRAAEFGLSSNEFIVLRDVLDHGPTSIKEIVLRTGLAQSRVSTTVQGLIAREYVTVTTDPDDRRKTIVECTTRVKSEAARIRSLEVRDSIESLVVGCSREERDEIYRSLERLSECLTRAGPRTS